MSQKGILAGHSVVRVSDLVQWARWYEQAECRVALTRLDDGVEVSTVFLGLNHGWSETPQWFETMIFGGAYDQDCERYATWDEAQAGHDRIVQALKEGSYGHV